MNQSLSLLAKKQSIRGAIALFCCFTVAFAFASLRTFSAQIERLYTQAQAERGKPLYAQHCANCHGQSLEGTPSSPLAGERFIAKWNDRFNVGGPINGGVITYAINGRQYVAINSGNASGFWRAQRGSATVLLFALPESKP